MALKRYTKTKYWDKNYVGIVSKMTSVFSKVLSNNIYSHELASILKPYMKKGNSLFEVGCAPGTILLPLAKKFQLNPFGIEYSKPGCEMTQANFAREGFPKEQVIYGDFFSREFIKKHANKYDIVSSFGFIEHFDDVTSVIDNHVTLLKKKGILILSIPNLSKQQCLFLEKEIIDKHNLSIMSPKKLRKVMPKTVEIKRNCYFGGAFNVGMFSYKSALLTALKNILLVIQRLTFDPLSIVLHTVGIRCNNKYFSPSIIIIGIKK